VSSLQFVQTDTRADSVADMAINNTSMTDMKVNIICWN